jgi:hypothetical protein
MTRTLLDELHVGTRTIENTEWPVVDQLWRTGPRSWEIVRELCNGVPRSTETYRSEAKAREAFGSRIEGRKPRAGARSTVRIALRITEREDAAWRAAAGGRPVSKWLREAAELAIARGSTR